jgi:hypothetical protein
MTELSDIFTMDLAAGLAAAWGGAPRVFRRVLRAPVFAEDEFMAGLVGTATDYLAAPGAGVPAGRLFVSGEAVTGDRLAPFLPRGLSETCREYVSRIRQDHPRDEIGMVLDACEKHMPATRDRLTPVLHGLFARVGYPARQNHTCIYAGTYRTTPFGIHRDDCHVLMFCGVGRKTMAFWPRPYFEHRTDLIAHGKLRARVEDHRAQATVLEIGSLDVMYWSPDEWHVAISETNDFHASLSVGLYHDGSSTEKLLALDFLAAVARESALDLHGLPAAPDGRLSAADLAAGPMAPFFEQWGRLRDVLSRPGEAEFRALVIALRLISSAGYGKLLGPPPAGQPPLDGSLLHCRVPEALVLARARHGLMVGANGRVFFYERAADAIEALVRTLRQGAPCRFEDVIDPPDAAPGRVIASVIRDLANAGAVTVRAGTDTAPPA